MNKNFYKDLITSINTDNSALNTTYMLSIVDGEKKGSKLLLCLDKNLGSPFNKISYDAYLEDFWNEHLPKLNFSKAPYLDSSGIFVENLNPKIQLVICGGGHVSQALSKLSDFLGFELTILEEREEFGNYKRFPNAKHIIVDTFENIFANHSFSKNSCFVIATRGHVCDGLCLESILTMDFCYAGMIGSKKKIGKTREQILSKGFSEETFKKVKTPIGLPIGGQSPEEIAISIMAEIIQTINQNPRSYFSDQIMETIENTEEKMILAKIIAKTGSSPRGIGSQMLIKGDGTIVDTIGGGLIEYSVIQDGVSALKEELQPFKKHYVLDSTSAASLGMWCGGTLDIFFDIVN